MSDLLSKPRWRPSMSTVAAVGWLLVVAVPLYYMVIATLRTDDTGNPLVPPPFPRLDSYARVLGDDFLLYLGNSVLTTALTVVAVLLFSLLAAYSVVRGRRRVHRMIFRVFLVGIAIPLQATIIPVYLLITSMGLYDSLLAVVLPSVAFALPLSILVLTNFLRDIPGELYEAMWLDGARQDQVLLRLVLPMARPGLMAVGIYQALQVWNGLLFPLILTQRPEISTLPLALWHYQGEYTVDVRAVLTAVLLSALPVLFLYVTARRALVAGLTAGAGR